MNRLKSPTLSLLLLLVVLVVSSYAEAGSKASVTVYNSGRALVTEARTVSLPKGLANVVIKNIPTTLDPTSVRAAAKGMQVLGLEYTYLPITQANLLDRYVGKELNVILPDPTDAKARIVRKAMLLSNQQAPIFMVGKEVYVGNYEALLLPSLPEDLQQEPALTLTTKNKSAGTQDIRLTYLMGGLRWRADYALELNAKGSEAGVNAWATVTNSSGRAFSGADLKLVAGDVQQAGGARAYKAVSNAMVMEDVALASPAPVQESFSQYHLYTVPGAVDLAAQGTRQINLFSHSGIKVTQELISRFQASAGQRNGKITQNVESSISFDNTKAGGMGVPMPGGLVRVFMPTRSGQMLLAGETHIGHVGIGGKVKLRLGRAFDVKVERTQTGFTKLGKRSYEMTWRIEVTNGRDKAQSVLLQEMLSGEWEIVNSDRKYTKLDSGRIQYVLNVPANGNGKPMIVNYTVRVTY